MLPLPHLQLARACGSQKRTPAQGGSTRALLWGFKPRWYFTACKESHFSLIFRLVLGDLSNF